MHASSVGKVRFDIGKFTEFAEPELDYSWLSWLVQKVGEAGLVTLRITILEPDLSPMFDEASSLHIKTRRLEKIRLSLISSKAKGSYIKCEEYRAWPCQTSLTWLPLTEIAGFVLKSPPRGAGTGARCPPPTRWRRTGGQDETERWGVFCCSEVWNIVTLGINMNGLK